VSSDPVPAARRLPGLDGLRGLAILVVLVHHLVREGSDAWPDRWLFGVAQQGHVGVDLFFVLSGFLITGILLDAKGKRGFLLPFYARRVLRLLPLYYGAVAVLALTGTLAGVGAWYWTHTVNWLIALRGDFAAAPAWTSVFWSLSIEEQFYLVWPFVVAGTSSRGLLRVCAGIAVASLAARVGLAWADAPWATIYASTLTRLDPLALGGALAVLARRPQGLARWRPVAVRTALVAGPLAVALAVLPLPDGAPELLGASVMFSVVAAFWAAILVLSQLAAPTSLGARFLDSRPMKALGTYSYGIYVLHTAVASALWRWLPELDVLPTPGGSQLLGQLVVVAVGGVVSCVGAYALYHLYEKHFLALKRFVPLERRSVAPVDDVALEATR
jgi:peptidoglycan/LPS O-acetylase OafA/YrhL